MNWPRFVVHGILAVLAGVIVTFSAGALFPELPQWAMTVIGGAVTGFCMPVAVGRSRNSKGPEKDPLKEEPDEDRG